MKELDASKFEEYKKLYNYCTKVNWNEEKIEELGKELNYNVKEIRQMALDYFEQTYYKFEKKFSFFKNVYKYGQSVNWDKEKLEKYPTYDLTFYALGISKTKLNELIEYYEKELLALGGNEGIERASQEQQLQELYLPVINPVLSKENIKTYLLWKNDAEKEIVLKYIYEQFKLNEGIMGQVAREFGIPVNIVFKYINMYLKEKYNRILTNPQGKPANAKAFVYEKLKKIKIDDIEEIVKLIDNSGINVNSLYNDVFDYTINYNCQNEKEMLKNKINAYRKYKLEQKKILKQEENNNKILEKLDKITKMIKDFIYSDCEKISDFCIQNQINEKTFSSYVEIIKEYNIELYNQYSEKINNLQKQRYAIIVKEVKKISKLIIYGIEEYSITRKFDIVDYFQNTTLSFEDFFRIAKNIVSAKELTIIKKFIIENRNYEQEDLKCINSILNEMTIINPQTTKSGRIIPGTGEEITKETKQKLIDYLKYRKVPINRKTYTIIFKRYRDGLIDIEKQNTKKK